MGLGGYTIKLNKDLQKIEGRAFIQEVEIKLLEFEVNKCGQGLEEYEDGGGGEE